MAESFKYELKGVKEVLDALEALEPKQLLSIIKAVERKALNETIVKPLKAALPYSAQTEKSIRVVQDKYNRLGFWAGITSDAFWLRFVEKGTDIRTTESGANRGSISARNNAVPTILGQTDDVIKFFNEDFGTEVEKIINRKLKKLNL